MKIIKRWRLTLVILIMVGLVFGGWFFYRQTLNDTYPRAWSDWRDKLQAAVDKYQNTSGSLPTIDANATITVGGEKCLIIDMCELKTSTSIPAVPDSSASIEGGDNDNCDGGNCTCYSSAHYVWMLDPNGSVCSACIGDGCIANNADGYQGVWP